MYKPLLLKFRVKVLWGRELHRERDLERNVFDLNEVSAKERALEMGMCYAKEQRRTRAWLGREQQKAQTWWGGEQNNILCASGKDSSKSSLLVGLL